MDKKLQKARKDSGIARFERECGYALELGKRRKAWRVPGTMAAGQWAILNTRTQKLLREANQ